MTILRSSPDKKDHFLFAQSIMAFFVKAENPMPSTTDDKFLMEVAVGDNEKKLVSLLKKTGAIEVKAHEKKGES